MKLVIPQYYEKAVSLFGHRLQLKHKVKGLAHREMSYAHLSMILQTEVNELDKEITVDNGYYGGDRTIDNLERIIDEALDIMICGMILVDRVLQEIGNTPV